MGPTKQEGGRQVKFYPVLKGGATQSSEVILTPELEVLAIMMGWGGGQQKSFHPLKGGKGGGWTGKVLPFSHL